MVFKKKRRKSGNTFVVSVGIKDPFGAYWTCSVSKALKTPMTITYIYDNGR